jgi:hypothetical protein
VVEYEVGPDQWVTVYPDGRVVYPPGMQRSPEDGLDQAPPPPQRRTAKAVPPPLPKSKPALSQGAQKADDTLAALDLPPDSKAADPMPTGSVRAVSCQEAQRIVADFGFSNVKATSCSGKIFSLEGTRDGSAYAIKLSAADGELTEVKKR